MLAWARARAAGNRPMTRLAALWRLVLAGPSDGGSRTYTPTFRLPFPDRLADGDELGRSAEMEGLPVVRLPVPIGCVPVAR